MRWELQIHQEIKVISLELLKSLAMLMFIRILKISVTPFGLRYGKLICFTVFDVLEKQATVITTSFIQNFSRGEIIGI